MADGNTEQIKQFNLPGVHRSLSMRKKKAAKNLSKNDDSCNKDKKKNGIMDCAYKIPVQKEVYGIKAKPQRERERERERETERETERERQRQRLGERQRESLYPKGRPKKIKETNTLTFG